MCLNEARIAPLEPTDIPADYLAKMGAERPVNFFSTLYRKPDLYDAWMIFATYMLTNNSLPARHRELVILRTAHQLNADYEWSQHVPIAKMFGVTDEEIDHIIDGPDHPSWNNSDRALLQATDELHATTFVTDETWEQLADLDEGQKLDFLFTVGMYTTVAMFLNAVGMQLDPGTQGLPQRASGRNGED